MGDYDGHLAGFEPYCNSCPSEMFHFRAPQDGIYRITNADALGAHG